ncbi:MAG: hypothetical protein JW850_20290 [Thermoflexales bacterium]|nr:hypothetical protein [Thermoflexales bacterium]
MSENVLTARQQKGVTALLATQTIGEAARLAGVSERTLTRWLAKREFRAAVDAACQDALGAVVRRLIAGRDTALDTLFRLMQDADSENVQRQAAMNWLDVLHKVKTLEEFEARIAALEKQITGGGQ